MRFSYSYFFLSLVCVVCPTRSSRRTSWESGLARWTEPKSAGSRHEHWGSSGFANTDLDLQLKRHGIQKLIIMGLIAHTCVEATVRYAAELGYEVPMVKDATASYSDKEMHAALDVNIPNYASAIVSTNEIVDSLSWDALQ